MKENKYAKFAREAEASIEYWTQIAVRDFTRDLGARMDAQTMNRAELAEKLGTSPAYVTKVLRGDANFTLETMTKLSKAVGGKLRVHIADKASRTRWMDTFVLTAPPAQDRANTAVNVFTINTNLPPMKEARVDGTISQPVISRAVGL